MKRFATGLLAAGFTVASVATASSAFAGPTTHKAHHPGSHHGSHHGAPSVPSYTPPPIDWGTCTSASMVAAGARCGLLTVPLDYAKPNGAKIKIGVSEIKHLTSDADAQGIMLVNPGGPGGSGLNLARLGAFVPNGGGDPYDWIGFDPRGVGISLPSLACDGDYFPTDRPDYVPATRTLKTFWLKKSKGYAKACKQVGGKLLDHLKTTDTTNDIESIRKAFGQQQINYYGFSYGTTIGQVYATQHPDRVRRMVLDGIVNPADDPYVSNLKQDTAFEKTENLFFAWVAQHNDTYGLGTTGKQVRKLWDSMLDKSRVAAFDGQIGPDEWTDAFLSAGYYVYGWTDTADAFKAAVNGDYKPIEAAYAGANGAGPGSDNGFAIYLGTQCTDSPWPSSQRKIFKDNWKTYAKAPFETWANAWFNGPCSTWAGKAAPKPFKVDGSKVAPVLMIEETFDAATPFPGAIEARKRFPKSVLIEGVNGTTHAGSLSGVTCTDDRIANYLLSGKLDARVKGNQSDVKCDPVPAPEPTAVAATSRQAVAGQGMPSDLRKIITSAQR
jgi:pimeloyl-ACP methyl ester carboxylesterase